MPPSLASFEFLQRNLNESLNVPTNSFEVQSKRNQGNPYEMCKSENVDLNEWEREIVASSGTSDGL